MLSSTVLINTFNIKTICKITTDLKDQDYQKRSTNKDIKNQNVAVKSGGIMMSIVKFNTPRYAIHKWVNNYNCRILPKRQKSEPGNPSTRKTSPERIWRPVGLTFLSLRRPGIIKISLLKMHIKSHTPEPRAEAVIWQETKASCWF